MSSTGLMNSFRYAFHLLATNTKSSSKYYAIECTNEVEIYKMSAGDSNNVIYGLCPSWALSVGYLGICCSVILSNFGAAVRFSKDTTSQIVT